MAVKFLLVLSLAVVAVSSAGILETLLSWDLHDTEGRSSAPQPKCLCQVNGCLCCVELTLAAGIDVVRPACVNINQKNNNVTLNLSYGDNPVHNATINIDDAANKPTCMNLLADFAHLCAKFTSVGRQASGHTGCLVIEPVFMGTAQDTYPMGCFNFDQGVKQVESPVTVETTKSPNSQDTAATTARTTLAAATDDEEDDESINADELIAAVSESAEQGLALFSRWLGIKFNAKTNVTDKNDSSVETSVKRENDNTSVTSRSGRAMVLDNQPTHEEKSDERFKQLLSAQDNILKESEMIGNTDGGKTTFVFAQIPDNLQNRKEILPVVPRESRRGGRAYNIHQHINEI